MEPRILMLGREQDIIDDLVAVLTNEGRDVVGTDDWEVAKEILTREKIDLVVISAGLEDTVRKEISQDIKRLLPTIPILWEDRASGPEGMLDFVTSIAEDFRTGT